MYKKNSIPYSQFFRYASNRKQDSFVFSKIVTMIKPIHSMKNISFIVLFFLGGMIINPSLHAQGYISAGRAFGVTGNDIVNDIITDNGYSYVLHSGAGLNFPVTLGGVPTGTGNKGKLMKLNPAGEIVWSRYLPLSSTGTGATTFSKMALDNGVLHLLGTTTAANVPVTDGSSASGGGSDILYAKLDPSSGNILHTGYQGGSGAESTGLDMAIENGNAYITYTTQSSDIAVTTGPAYASGFDHVITKLDASGNTVYSTYTGSASATATNTEKVSLAVDNGNAWLTMLVGATNNFTTTDGTTFNGEYDFGIVRLDASGNKLFSALYGGTADEDAPVTVVKNGELYLTGYSTSINYPTTDGSSASSQAKQHIITKFNSSNTRAYSGYLAGVGAGSDIPQIHVENGAVYLLVSTHGSTPSIATTDGSGGGSYIIKLNAVNGAVQFATAFGGSRLFANRTGTTLVVENNYIYTATPVVNAGLAYTTDGTSRKGHLGVFLTRHSTDGQLHFASWLASAGSVGNNSFSMDVSNDKIYLSGDALGIAYPATMPAIGTTGGLDVAWAVIALCPSFPADNIILPLSQTICKEGIPQTLTGNKVVYTSDNMPTLYRNGVAEQQAEIRARYQWQSADSPSGPWTNITGTGTQQDFTPPSGSADKYYRRLALAPPGCTPELISTSDVAAVLVSVDNSPTVTGAVFNTCAGTSVDINVVATGGTAPYTYTWDNGISSITDAATVTPAANSVYTATVTDANGCQQIGQAIVNAYAADAGPATASVCAGQPVRIGTAPPAGLAGVTYAWTPAADLDDGTIAQPLASPAATTSFEVSMTIPVTGGGTCTTTDIIEVIPVTAPSADFAGTDKVICKGGSTAIGTSAEAGFSYAWTPGNYLSSASGATATFNAGSGFPEPNSFTYTLNASKSGCTFSDQVKVSVIQANAGKDYCGPRTVGIADPAPNVVGKTFLWEVVSGPGTITGATSTPQTTVSASSGGSTIYRLTVSLDGVDCTDEVLVPQCTGGGSDGCPDPEIRVVSGYTCPAASFGEVTLRAFPSNLSPTEWTYSWTSSTGTGISSASGSTVTLTDNIEKDVTLTVTHVDNPLISCSETIHVNDPSWAIPVFPVFDQKICPGGTINIGLPAIPGYSYLWSTVEPGDEALSNPAVSPAITRDYIAIVTDDISGCTYKDTVTVTVQPLINDPGPDWMVCSNSMITLGSPALPGYTYSWIPSTASYQDGTDENSAEPKVLIAASQDFSLTVTDTETGCTSDSTIQITIDESSTLPALSDTTICPGESVVIGNQAFTGATYSWLPATGLSSTTVAQPTATPAVTTLYTVTVTFYNELGSPACTKTGTVTVTVSAPAITMGDEAVCPSGAVYDLSTGVSVTGATSYAWSPAILITSPNVFNTTVKANPATPTTFTLTATDVNGCSVSASKIVSPTNPPPIAGSSGLVCLGSSITLGDNSNTGALSWLWTVDPDEGLSGTLSSYTDPAPVFTPAAADLGKTFTFNLSQDIGGCINSSSVKITVKGFTLNNIPVQTVCSNASTSIGVTPASGVSYQWTPATGLSHPGAATTMVNNITGTSIYTLTATDATGCVATTEAVVGVNPMPSPDITIPDVTAPFGGSAPPFNPQVTGSAPYTYTWTPAATLDNPYIANATATSVSIGTTTYNLNVTDANGCTSSAPANLVVKVMGTLPVYLSSVTAQNRGCSVFINWKAESAESFSNFVVERSGDGNHFSAIATVYYDVNRFAYSFNDVMPGNGNWKYRLKLVDIDGRFTYSSVLMAKVNCVEQAGLSIFPNPVDNIVYIKSSKAISKIMLVSITGQTISQYVPSQNQPGIYSIPLRGKIAQGLYILQVTATDGTVQNSKLIKE